MSSLSRVIAHGNMTTHTLVIPVSDDKIFHTRHVALGPILEALVLLEYLLILSCWCGRRRADGSAVRGMDGAEWRKHTWHAQ